MVLLPRQPINSPSWSWASINGKVDFETGEPDSRYWLNNYACDFDVGCVQIKECYVKPFVDESKEADNLPYSAISGRMVLTGHIQAAK
jgi:hypothetical protein